jgi:hypothetical protein
MTGNSRSLAAALLALLAMALVVGTASASRIGFSPAESISMQGPLTVTLEGGTAIRCNVTLRGTITRALVGVGTGETLGTITESTISGCSGGIFTLLTPFPMTVPQVLLLRGETLVGVLILLERTGVLIDTGSSRCLYGTRLGVLVGIVSREPGQITDEVRWLTNGIPLIRNLGLGPCVLVASTSGTFTFTPTQRVTYLP